VDLKEAIMMNNHTTSTDSRTRLPRLPNLVKGSISAALEFSRNIKETLQSWLKIPGKEPAAQVQQRANRAASVDVDWFQGTGGAGAGWARTEYGEYYATSVAGT